MTAPELTEREAAQLREVMGGEQSSTWSLAALVVEQIAAHGFTEREMATAAGARDINLSQPRVNQLGGWHSIVTHLRSEGLITAVITPPEWELRPLVSARRKGLTNEQITVVWEHHQAEPKKSYATWMRELYPDLFPPPEPKGLTKSEFEAEAHAFVERFGLDAFQSLYFRVKNQVTGDAIQMKVS